MASSSDIEQEHGQVPENVNSPAYSDMSSPSSNSTSSTESDANELEVGTSSAEAAETVTGEQETKDDEEERESQTAAKQVIPSHRELNGIVTLTTTTSSHPVASPLSSDPEDDMQDLHGDESDVQASIEEYAPEERMHSMSDPSSEITAVLQSSSSILWKQFDAIGTEMIVTRKGRYTLYQHVCVCVCVCVC